MMMSCTTKSTQSLDFTGYLFAYFEGGGDPHQQEQLRFAISEDAMNWHALNGNRPIIASDTISNSGGIRDPYIMRGEENRHHWFADAKVKYKMKRIDLEMEASNLFNQQAYTQVNYSNLNIYRNVCQLRPMNVVAKVRFKLL